MCGAWHPLLPWSWLWGGWGHSSPYEDFYHKITQETCMYWCPPHLRQLSDRPASSSLRQNWSLVRIQVDNNTSFVRMILSGLLNLKSLRLQITLVVHYWNSYRLITLTLLVCTDPSQSIFFPPMRSGNWLSISDNPQVSEVSRFTVTWQWVSDVFSEHVLPWALSWPFLSTSSLCTLQAQSHFWL